MNRTLDKIGTTGVWVAALSCPACFPALGSLVSLLGLGFLSAFEGFAINVFITHVCQHCFINQPLCLVSTSKSFERWIKCIKSHFDITHSVPIVEILLEYLHVLWSN